MEDEKYYIYQTHNGFEVYHGTMEHGILRRVTSTKWGAKREVRKDRKYRAKKAETVLIAIL